MAQFKVLKNTDKEYPCTSCGSTNVSIIREDPAGSNPRLKCGSCSFMFNGQDSLAASEAGAIKPSSAETLATADEPEVQKITFSSPQVRNFADTLPIKSEVGSYDLPKTPAYVFIAKDKTSFQFCRKADFKRTAIRWSSLKHDVYELNKITLNVKVDVS